MRYIILISILLLAVLTAGCTGESGSTGNAISAGYSEDIEIKGSDTLLQMVSNMAEAYTVKNKNAKISVTGGGSGTGIAALINGEIDIADASRAIKKKELTQAKDKGIDPWEFIIAQDMLSVIVNKDNPVAELTIEQVSEIYKGQITNWNNAGGEDKEITLYGRQSTSGTYSYFMKKIVEGDYSSKMMNMEGNQAIVDAVRQDKTAIGYVGVGYIVDDNGNQINGIKIIKLSKDMNSDYISPLDKTKRADYPISRPLFQYLSKKPLKDSAVYKFLVFELSEEGQKIVKKSGFIPITAEDREHNNALLKKI
ncbi:MAG: phosphate-binding protein [Candidatus Nanohalarchaeota archaeon]|nr:MAG: phosphate-binding protein [Candidatus Nanohaloarchaeota archaeon]